MSLFFSGAMAIAPSKGFPLPCSAGRAPRACGEDFANSPGPTGHSFEPTSLPKHAASMGVAAAVVSAAVANRGVQWRQLPRRRSTYQFTLHACATRFNNKLANGAPSKSSKLIGGAPLPLPSAASSSRSPSSPPPIQTTSKEANGSADRKTGEEASGSQGRATGEGAPGSQDSQPKGAGKELGVASSQDLTRVQYIKKHLHAEFRNQVSDLTDQELYRLGQQTSTNTQRTVLQEIRDAATIEHASNDLSLDDGEGLQQINVSAVFFGLSRKEFLKLHLHISLQNGVSDLTDEQLFALGQQDIEDQLRRLSRMRRNYLIEHRIAPHLQKPADQLSAKELRELSNEDMSRQDHVLIKLRRHLYIKCVIHPFLKNLCEHLDDDELEKLGANPKPMQHEGFMKMKPKVFVQHMIRREIQEDVQELSDADIVSIAKENVSKQRQKLEEICGRVTAPVPGLARRLSEAQKEVQQIVTHQSQVLALNLKGDLYRCGSIDLLVVADGPDSRAYAFDIEELSKQIHPKKRLFEHPAMQPLKRLLQSPDVSKVMHDCRTASDVLLHLYGVELQNVFDVAVGWSVLNSSERHVPAFSQVVKRYAPTMQILPTNSADDSDSSPEGALHGLMKEPLHEEDMARPTILGTSGNPRISDEELDREKQIAQALLAVSVAMVPGLKRWRPDLVRRCAGQVRMFRQWPGQHIDAFDVGRGAMPFEFKSGKLCVLDAPQNRQVSVAKKRAGNTAHIDEDSASLLGVLPASMRQRIESHLTSCKGGLVEVVVDVGQRPVVRWRPTQGRDFKMRFDEVGDDIISTADIEHVAHDVASKGSGFNDQDRAGINGTLHRISATKNSTGHMIGFTLRCGRPSDSMVRLLEDIVTDTERSVLFLGPPGVGKTTLLRACAKMKAETMATVVVDPAGEIAGCGDTTHPAVGRSRKDAAYFPDSPNRSEARRRAMGRVLENMMPQVIVVDEIGTADEAKAARTIGERGVQLVATAHGRTLRDLLSNSELQDLVGGTTSVTLGDGNPRYKAEKQKTVRERRGRPVFPILVELRSPRCAAVHRNVGVHVDDLLENVRPVVEVRSYDDDGNMYVVKEWA